MGKRLYKCTTCKTDNSLTKEEKDKKFSKEEMGVVNGNKYCLKHYEEMLDKKTKCSHCEKNVVRRIGSEYLVAIRFKGEEVQKKDKFFCSEECSKAFEEDVIYKDKFVRDFMTIHNYKDTSEVNRLVFIQMANLGKKYNMSYKGMWYTLSYLKTKRVEIAKDSIWAIVNNYDNAREYFALINKRKREVEESEHIKVETRRFKLPEKLNRRERASKLLYLPED